MPINNFKPFSADAGANVTSQADYEALPALKSGFTAGKASSAQMNKAIRQGTFIASAIAQFVANKTGQDVLDNGDVNGFVAKLVAGLSEQSLTRANPFADIKSDGSQAVATALENLGLGDAVTKAAGAMQKTANGSDIQNASLFRTALGLGAAATRNVGMGSASNLVDMDSIRSLMTGNGYIQLPSVATTGNNLKVYLQWGSTSTPPNSNNTYNVNIAFPNTILFAMGNRWTNGSNASMNVNAVGAQGLQIQNWAPGGSYETCAWIAIGY